MLHITFNWRSILRICSLAILILSIRQSDPALSQEPTPLFTFTKIVDTKTEIPGLGKTFTAFGGPFDNGPSISNGVIAFNSQGPDNYQAVFTYNNINGRLIKLVDTNTLVPGKNVNFTHFGHPSVGGRTTTFTASYGVDPPSPLTPTDNTAILAASRAQLRIIADDNTPVPSDVGTFFGFYGGAHGIGDTAFLGYNKAGEVGIYVAHRTGAIDVLADPRTQVSVVRELSFNTDKPVAVTIPGIEDEFVGDRFVILAEDVKVHPIAQTRIDMLAANTGPLYIVSESTIPPPSRAGNECLSRSQCLFNGFPNLATGNATLSLQTVNGRQVLVVDNIGSSLDDGVAQLVPGTMEMQTELLTPNFSLSTMGATLVTTQVGPVGTMQNQQFSSLKVTNIGGRLMVIGDWSFVGTTSYTIKVYNGNELVTSQRGLSTGELVLNGTPDITLMRCHIWIIHWIIVGSSTSISGQNVTFCVLTMDGNKAVLLYNSQKNMLELVADRNTSIPRGTGNFTDFGVREGFDQGVVAFIGHGDNGQEGVYLYKDGELSVIADTNTPIPNGDGNFTHFSLTNDVSVSNGNIAFTGVGENEQGGIYLTNKRGELMSIIQNGDTLDGMTIEVIERTTDFPWWTITPPLNMNAEGFDRKGLVFIVEFPDLSSAIYHVRISDEVLK